MPSRVLAALALLGFFSSTAAVASPPPRGKPSIIIVSPRNGAIIRGGTVTVRVKVANFRLVKPVLLSPSQWHTIPLLKGNQGHIHYLLDNVANLVLTRDVVVRTTHTWTDVTPGRHTIVAYLATSQHAPFPGVRAASVSITVVSPASPQKVSGPVPSITITSSRITRTRAGVTVLVRVHVSNFKIVRPVTKNPPMLTGNVGYVNYVLDSLMNSVSARDAATALSHPWGHVSPGPHTIFAYLANSQHQLFPGTRPAVLHVTILDAAAGGPVALTVGNLPVTGAAGTHGTDTGAPPWAAFVLAVAGLILALGAHRRWPATSP